MQSAIQDLLRGKRRFTCTTTLESIKQNYEQIVKLGKVMLSKNDTSNDEKS